MLNLGWKDAMEKAGNGNKGGEGRSSSWGQVRRRNLFARIRNLMLMTLLGVASLALVGLVAVFAASVVLVGALACALIFVATFVLRGLVRAPVRARAEVDPKAQAKGVFTARKVGNTWVSY